MYHNCCDWASFFAAYLKDYPIESPCMTVRRTALPDFLVIQIYSKVNFKNFEKEGKNIPST